LKEAIQPPDGQTHLIAEEDRPMAATAAKKKSTRKYSPSASKNVETEMKEMKKGTLKSGKSGKKVTDPKQAIAIGLSKARKEGKKVPPPPKES
jgi:hypothetical protein